MWHSHWAEPGPGPEQCGTIGFSPIVVHVWNCESYHLFPVPVSFSVPARMNTPSLAIFFKQDRVVTNLSFSPPSPPISCSARSSFLVQRSTWFSRSTFFCLFASSFSYKTKKNNPDEIIKSNVRSTLSGNDVCWKPSLLKSSGKYCLPIVWSNKAPKHACTQTYL